MLCRILVVQLNFHPKALQKLTTHLMILIHLHCLYVLVEQRKKDHEARKEPAGLLMEVAPTKPKKTTVATGAVPKSKQV